MVLVQPAGYTLLVNGRRKDLPCTGARDTPRVEDDVNTCALVAVESLRGLLLSTSMSILARGPEGAVAPVKPGAPEAANTVEDVDVSSLTCDVGFGGWVATGQGGLGTYAGPALTLDLSTPNGLQFGGLFSQNVTFQSAFDSASGLGETRTIWGRIHVGHRLWEVQDVVDVAFSGGISTSLVSVEGRFRPGATVDAASVSVRQERVLGAVSGLFFRGIWHPSARLSRLTVAILVEGHRWWRQPVFQVFGEPLASWRGFGYGIGATVNWAL